MIRARLTTFKMEAHDTPRSEFDATSEHNCVTMSSTEQQVCLAAKNLLEHVAVLGHDENGGEDPNAAVTAWMHPRVSVCCVDTQSSSRPSAFATTVGSFAPLRNALVGMSQGRWNGWPHQNEPLTVDIRSVRCLDVGSRDAAAVQVRLFGGAIDGWLIFLHCRLDEAIHDDDDDDDVCSLSWRCISAAFTISSSVPDQQGAILPEKQWHEVLYTVWNGYCAANRACDGAKILRNALHATFRLTYCDEAHRNTVQIKDAETFASMVTTRYEGGKHAQFQHLKDDPRVSAEDALLAVDFCAPDCCMVVLKVGHPPCLWTDLLTCMCIDRTWWIVHKSSCHEDFLLELAM